MSEVDCRGLLMGNCNHLDDCRGGTEQNGKGLGFFLCLQAQRQSSNVRMGSLTLDPCFHPLPTSLCCFQCQKTTWGKAYKGVCGSRLVGTDNTKGP